MEFFSSEIASTLQYFSFPLEVVGLTLAAIEVRFQDVAKAINEYLLRDFQESSREVKGGWRAILLPEPSPGSRLNRVAYRIHKPGI